MFGVGMFGRFMFLTAAAALAGAADRPAWPRNGERKREEKWCQWFQDKKGKVYSDMRWSTVKILQEKWQNWVTKE